MMQMTNFINQLIFKNSAVDRMKRDLSSSKTLETYYDPIWKPKDDDIWSTRINIPEWTSYPVLDGDSGPASDCENAIIFFKFFALLDETMASDQRLWAYFSHVEFRSYAFARWAKPKELKDLYSQPEIESKAVNWFLEHWFTSDNSRSLRRHALARLWWAVKLTHSPWETNSDYASSENDDPYYLTRALFLTQDVYQAVLERNLGRSKCVLFAILEFLNKNPEFSRKESVGYLTKWLNLEYGIRRLSNLNRVELLDLIQGIASEYIIKWVVIPDENTEVNETLD
jgi:Family of unknown function (DUF6339)